MRLKAGAGILVVLVLAFGVFWWQGRPDAVFGSVVAPVQTIVRPPQYVAELPGGPHEPAGLLVRAGDDVRRLPAGHEGEWLNDGRLIAIRLWTFKCLPEDRFPECSRMDGRVLDPRTGRLAPITAVPGRVSGVGRPTLHRVQLFVARETRDVPVEQTVALRPDLTDPRVLRLPTAPDGRASERSLGGTFTIGDWHYVRYSDTIGQQTSDEYGYLRQRMGDTAWEKVLVDQRLVATWVSRDGRALLGLQQKRGEPCGGCTVQQRIVEIDPDTATIAAVYGTPPGYDKTWRVGDVDKIGEEVLVRYVHRKDVPESLGVWRFDGDWELVEGTRGLFAWWQGAGRIEAVPGPPPRAYATLWWVEGGRRVRLPGEVSNHALESWKGAPGSLAPPP